MDINKYFHVVPLWKSPIKLSVELPVDEAWTLAPELSHLEPVDKDCNPLRRSNPSTKIMNVKKYPKIYKQTFKFL